MPRFQTSEKLSAHMRTIRKTDTKPELAVRRLVHAMGYRYRLGDALVLTAWLYIYNETLFIGGANDPPIGESRTGKGE